MLHELNQRQNALFFFEADSKNEIEVLLSKSLAIIKFTNEICHYHYNTCKLINNFISAHKCVARLL